MSKNDVTGDTIKTKVGEQEKYAEGFDRIWGKKPKVPAGYTEEEPDKDNPYNQWIYEDKST